MPAKYKLVYFNAPGRAEHIRYIFAYAGQDFEDSRISKEEWTIYKPKTPFGKIPVLEIDGKPVSQSNAIARYLAKQYGLLGKDDWTILRADELVEVFNDYRMVAMRIFRKEDAHIVDDLKQQQSDFLSKFNKIVSENSSGLLVGSEVTWADLTYAAGLSGAPNYVDFIKPYPALAAFVEKINNLPGIKEYLQKRPQSDYTRQSR